LLALVEISLPHCEAPILYVHMLVTMLGSIFDTNFGQWDCFSIEVSPNWCARQLENGRGKIGMGGNDISLLSLGHAGSPNDERDVDVLFETALFAWLKSMLANVISIVAREDEVCVFQNPVLLQARDYFVDNLIHTLEDAESISVEMVVGIDVFLALSLQTSDPIRARRLLRVEVLRARDLDVLEQAFVSSSGNGRRKTSNNVLYGAFQVSDIDIAMRRHWGNGKEERFVGLYRIFQEAIGFLGKHIHTVFSFVAHRRVLVALIRTIEILIGERVQEEILDQINIR
jgi:hypothetical protein